MALYNREIFKKNKKGKWVKIANSVDSMPNSKLDRFLKSKILDERDGSKVFIKAQETNYGMRCTQYTSYNADGTKMVAKLIDKRQGVKHHRKKYTKTYKY